ncbi:MAG: DUF4058 family protein [Cyanobacteria bacterium J06576_12]
MPSPFPGMNPYLEHPDRWPTVHNRLIVAIADFLTPQLLPKYQVDIDKRIYEVTGLNTVFIGRPDVTVQRSRLPRETSQKTVSTPAKSPLQVTLPMVEEVREPYLEVKDAQTQKVVTAVEVLSPTNKRGDGRKKYLEKREKILRTQTNLIEIDLLTQGEPLPLSGGDIDSHYRVLVSKAARRPTADLYAFNLSEVIPAFPLPLASEDTEPTVELQTLLNEVYQKSGYDYFIDYAQDPTLPFSSQEIDWINTLLMAKGLRS